MSTATVPVPAVASASPTPFVTLADVLHHLGDIPADRVRWWPGTATVEDALYLDANGIALCELVDGILVEKASGLYESVLACVLGFRIENWNDDINHGFTAGAAGTIRIVGEQLRMPDLAFYRWDQFPDRQCPPGQAPGIHPDLAVEVLSPRNTRAEMTRKRREYFAAGTRLVWEVEPDDRLVRVYTDEDTFTVIDAAGTLDGGAVLPGFTLAVRRWFERANRGGCPSGERL